MKSASSAPITVAGLEDYFHTIENERELANSIETDSSERLAWSFLTKISRAALYNSGFPTDRIMEYEETWKTATGYQKKGKDGWEAFKTFYATKIGRLEKGLQGTTGRANLTQEEQDERENRLQEQLNKAHAACF